MSSFPSAVCTCHDALVIVMVQFWWAWLAEPAVDAAVVGGFEVTVSGKTWAWSHSGRVATLPRVAGPALQLPGC